MSSLTTRPPPAPPFPPPIAIISPATSANVFVVVNGDTIPEADETFFLDISNLTGGATIADGQGKATIEDDDMTAPETTIDSQPSNPSNTSSATFTFSGTDNVGLHVVDGAGNVDSTPAVYT